MGPVNTDNVCEDTRNDSLYWPSLWEEWLHGAFDSLDIQPSVQANGPDLVDGDHSSLHVPHLAAHHIPNRTEPPAAIDHDDCARVGECIAPKGLRRCRPIPSPQRASPRSSSPSAVVAHPLYTLSKTKSNADGETADAMESTEGAPPAPATSAFGVATAEEAGNLDLAQLRDIHPETPHASSSVQQAQLWHTPNITDAANILANGTHHAAADLTARIEGAEYDTRAADDEFIDNTMVSAYRKDTKHIDNAMFDDSETEADPQGYAKLMFPDGDYIVTTHDVEIGRNMEMAARYKANQRALKSQQAAQRDLAMYQQEPSQPSLPGDDAQPIDASNSGPSLEGRPAPQSTFSDMGGALSFGRDLDDEAQPKQSRKKQRGWQPSKSSTSTTSVAPANLHLPAIRAEISEYKQYNDEGEPYVRTLATLPVHTQRPEDINKISRRHLLLRFNFQQECWELSVLAKTAFLNEKLLHVDTIVPLKHNDEIQISTVTMVFKLPDSHRHSPGLSRGTFSQAGGRDTDDVSASEESIDTSPARRLTNILDQVEDSEEEPAERKKASLKIKLKPGKKPKEKKAMKPTAPEEEKTKHKINIKKQQPHRSPTPPPDGGKKTEKGKKPKEAVKVDAGTSVVPSIEPAAAPPVFHAEPGSALASVPLHELPQKRKGPGRPPKNGLVSKRDQALCNKKQKDYEKAGMTAPPFNELLEMVRQETKQKELANKMRDGALPAGTELASTAGKNTATTANKAFSAPDDAQDVARTGDASTEPVRQPSSPKPKRLARSPSPMKPESAYSDEDLKKPSATYVHILDEILRDHPEGQADLQEIYDRIQKRYPYYKYRVTTQGWQSSVRHNLLSADRFKPSGKSGKGNLWTINEEVPLEREKKKKPTPPPRGPMLNGQYSQYGGQQAYGNGVAASGQRPANGGPNYSSPYGQGQQGQHHQGPNGSNQQGHPQPATDAKAQQAYNPFDGLVPEILKLRSQFLAPHVDGPNFQAKTDWVSNIVTTLSNRFHEQGEPGVVNADSEDEKWMWAKLDELFKKYEHVKQQQKHDQQQQAPQRAADDQSLAADASSASAQAAHSDTGARTNTPHQQAQQTVQNAVANGVAYHGANGVMAPQASGAPTTAAGTGSGAIQPSQRQQYQAAVNGQQYTAHPTGQQPSALANGHQDGVAAAGHTRSGAPQSVPYGRPAATEFHPTSTTSIAAQAGPAPTATPGPPNAHVQPSQGAQPAAIMGNTGSSSAAPALDAAPHAAQMGNERFAQHALDADHTAASASSTGQSQTVRSSLPGEHQTQALHAATPPQSEAKASNPPPPAQQAPAAGVAGTKRVATEDAFEESDAKRVKTGE